MKHLFWLVAVLIAIARIAFAQSPGTQSSGVLEWSLWSNIEGAKVDDIKFHPQYAETPTVRQFVSGSASPVNYGENFGQRLRGLVTAPVTGEYIFWIASDDCSELWLGTSASRFNKRPIANVHGWTGVQNWDVYPSQGSIAINLQAGQKYWIEAIAKEATEGDHVEIAWQYPGQPRQLIPAQYLSAPPVDAEDMNDDNLPDVWADQFGIHGEYTDSDNDGVRNIDEYRLNLDPSEIDSDSNGVADGEQVDLDGTYLANLEGFMEWSVWKNIPGVQVKDLTVNPAFSGAPTIRGFVSGAATPVDHGDNFGQRLRGLVTAPVTGDYTFWIASDDSSELWLGTNFSRFSKRRIANLNGWTTIGNWDAYPSQRSFAVTLNEGQSYWIEAIAKEGSGGDHVEIAWQYPGQTRQPIPAQHVSAAIRDPQDLNDDNLPDQWASQFGVNGEYVDADGDGLSNFEEFRIGFDPSKKDSDDNGIDDDEQVSVGGTYLTTLEGTLEWSAWLGLPGVDIRDLTGSASFAGAPTVRRYVSEASSPSDYANDFGQRLRGTVTVPVTGEYTFWIASDDASELWLGTSGSRFSKRVIAGLRGWTSVQNWDAYPSQKSRTVTLQAGQKYWIEALAKDGGGMDHVAIAWAYPGQARQMIPAQFLAAPVADPEDLNDDNLPDPWALQYRVNGEYGDDDDDGVVNYQEYLLGTLPTEGDSDGNGVLDGQQLSFLGEYLATLEGTLEWSAWLELPGVDVRDLTGSTSFAGAPSVRRYVSEASSPVNYADNFGQRLRGTVTAPMTGEYTFWIASDDASELWLGTSGSRFSKRVIAGLRGSTSVQNWDVYPTQKSRTVTLQAGQKYWIEALAKDGGGMDHVAIAWAYLGQARQMIPAQFLAAPVADPEDLNDDNLPDAWAGEHGVSGEYGDADADGVLNYQEYRIGTLPTEEDTDGNGVLDGHQLSTLGEYLTTLDGTLEWSAWLRLPGVDIRDLTGHASFAGAPTVRRYVSEASSPSDYANDFGQRLRGTATAPMTGEYTFWIASDDASELWLGTSGSRFSKRVIAGLRGSTSVQNWDAYPSQKSRTVTLQAGQKYWIEALAKDGGGMDHVAIAWAYPGQARQMIPAQFLAAPVADPEDLNDDNLPDAWAGEHGVGGEYGDADGDGLSNFMEYRYGASPSTAAGIPGFLTREIWVGVNGDAVLDLVGSTKFLLPPDVRELWAGADYPPGNEANNFGQRFRGRVSAPVSGKYKFWVAGDDNCEVWLSTDERCFNKKRIAFIEGPSSAGLGWSGPHEFDRYRSQVSGELELSAGREYYIEVLHKEGGGLEHVAVAWQIPGAPREVIPARFLSSYISDPDDRDGDGLSDAWEQAQGLDKTDNGSIDPRQAMQGDLDGDGLTNWEELQMGSDPTGISNPGQFFSNSHSIEGADYSSATGTWSVMADNSIVAGESRGSIQYDFTVADAGVRAFELCAKPVGTVLGRTTTMPLAVYIDEILVGAFTLRSVNGEIANIVGLTQALTAGDHTIRIENKNSSADRTLQIVSIKILDPEGQDLNNDGVVDWLEIELSKADWLLAPLETYTSPVCIEGGARMLSQCRLLSNGQRQRIIEQVNDRWYADVALDPAGTTKIEAEFNDGARKEIRSVDWKVLNVVEVQDTTLNVRVGDSAQLSAFVPGVPAGEGNVTIWVSRDAAPSTERVIPANRAAVYTFSAPGQYSITAQYSDVAGSRIVGCVVNAISAEFGEAVETYVDRGRELALPGVSYSLTLECDRDLVASDAAILADTTHKIRITARQPGTHYIVARLHEDGPILARGTVSALQSVDAGVAADTEVISTYPDGDKLVRSGMVIDKLPTGGYAEVRIFVAGVTFEDGTTEQRFYDSDLDANGILYLNFNYPAGTLTSVCHRVYIYSAQGELVGSL